MATLVWEPGRLYAPGSLVLPRTKPTNPGAEIRNPSFEQGDVGWKRGGNWVINNNPGYTGAWCAQFSGSGTGELINEELAPVTPGRRISGRCYIKPATGSDAGRCRLYWFDSNGIELVGTRTDGGLVQGSGAWRMSSVSGSAPNGAAFVAIGVSTTKGSGTTLSVDAFSWDYVGAPTADGLMYKAVQPATGYSATTEPTWPATLGVTVQDNEVVWEAVSISRLIWEAVPLLVSGGTEPQWPTEEGGNVADGGISWTATSRRISDPNCPESDIVAIASSKVYAGDGDIIRYSATVNPENWSLARDAGFLPTGLQQYGSNPVAAIGPYRGNLVAFNAEAFQNWQIDENPESMALLDAMPIGSTRHHALTPVSGDLFFLASQGIRTIGIAGGSTNLQAGDVGMPVDPLVQELMRVVDASGGEIIGLYYPAAGQYWACFPTGGGQTEVLVYTMTRVGQVGAWSRYIFPFSIEDWCIKGDDLFVRSGDKLIRIGDDLVGDRVDAGQPPLPAHGVVWWPWLDLGSPGVTKMMIGFDLVSEGNPAIAVGYDQSNGGYFTDPYAIDPDTVPGQIVPMPISAPSFSIRLTFDGSAQWQFQAMSIYLQDGRSTS